MVPEKCVLRPLLFFLLFQMCTSVDTINGNQPITDGQVLVSAGGHFALGFFSPENSTNGNRYVGIWYNKVKQQTVVWVANRENPMKDSTGVVFTINRDGNLVVFDKHRKEALWSTNITTVATNGLEAKLLDSGNLVLSRQGIIVWQSFDYPTHTHLPGMRIGLNRKTGLNWSLTSWKSRDDPARGDYSFRIDPQGSPQSFLYKGSVRVWRSGPWNGVSWSGVPEMSQTYLFSYQFVNTSDEVYLTYNIYNTSIYSRFVLDESGLVQRQTWIDRDQRWNMFWSAPKDGCDEYGRCGPYGICITSNNFECTCASGFQPKSPADWYLRDGSEGCVRKRKWECGKGEGFLKLERVKLPDTTLASRVDTRLKPEECRNECLRNCSCTAYTSANISGSGCIAWYGDLMDIREYAEGGQDLYLRMDAIELAAQTRRNYKGFGKARMLVIVILVTVLLFLALCGSYFLWKRKRKDTIMKRGYPELILNFNTNSPGLEGSSNSQELEGTRIKSDLPFFDLSVIVAATDNFSSSNKLGQGGFGPVYKGRLFNGKDIAVKRLSKNSSQGIEEFKNEVMLIAKLQHRNLVRLLGCCIQEEEKMLMYEYMPNKSLDSFLFEQNKNAFLDWKKRFEIIVGIARGILYLHQDSIMRIIHRDLKASNVLLDADMNPKISDFGMARIFGGNQIQGNTNRVVGTYGYMSPEYAMNGLFSVKSDVFSFGVLVLEIISGKRNNGCNSKDPYLNLIGHVWELWKAGRVLDVVDSAMGDSYPSHQVLRGVHVGLLCVQESASDRPTMSDVVVMLGSETALHPPKQPAFIMKEAPSTPDSSTAGTGLYSVDEETITVLEAR